MLPPGFLTLYLNAFDPMEWLTIGLVVFAGVQVLVTHWAERSRIAERKEDARLLIERSYHVVWAEHFRLNSLDVQWQDADLVHMSAAGLLDASAVQSPSRRELLQAAGSLGTSAGSLAASAFTLADDMARNITAFNALVDSFAQGANPNDRATGIRQLSPGIEDWESRLKNGVHQLSLLFLDLSLQAPGNPGARETDLRGELQSELGRAVQKEIAERRGTGSIQSGN